MSGTCAVSKTNNCKTSPGTVEVTGYVDKTTDTIAVTDKSEKTGSDNAKLESSECGSG